MYLVFRWQWAVYVSIAVGGLGVLSPKLGKLIATGWDKLGWILGLIIPNIVMGIIFFVFLWPISVLSKISNKDPLMLKNKMNSTFLDFSPNQDAKRFENPW